MYGTGSNQALIGGRYRVLRQLSQGGFGPTLLAEDTHRFQELCVLKEFNPQVSDKLALDKAQQLFEREAGILYQLDHPQIPRFRELLRNGGRLLMVQDYVEGPTYQDLLERRRQYDGRFSEAEVTQLLTQILPVLQYLHGVGIVHRDICPENLIQRNADGRPVLIDFGGVKQLLVNVRYELGVPEPYQTITGEVTRLGKIGYAPEEQLLSGTVNPSTDLYALGVTALVLLTGKDPDQLYNSLTKRYDWHDLVMVSPQLGYGLDQMVTALPSQRFQSAGAVMAALNLVTPYPEDSSTWSTPMPVRMQPATPPPAPEPTVIVARSAPPSTRITSPPVEPGSGPTQVAPPARPSQLRSQQSRQHRQSSSGCLSALAGLLLVLGVGTGLWWWLKPLSLITQLGESEQVSADGSSANNPAFSEAEQARKQALQERALALEVNRSYLTQLTDQQFYAKHPDRQGTQLTDQPQDEPFRAEWDAIANANLDLLEANLSPGARAKLGRYNPTDLDRWKRDVNQLHVSSNALADLADARFTKLFPQQRGQGFVETPIDQIWFGLAQDALTGLQSGQQLQEIKFDPGTFSRQLEGSLASGAGMVYIVNLSAGQLTRINLEAPASSTKLSFYLPSPNNDLPYLLADSDQTTWAGELPQTGYYEVVVVSIADQPIAYRLTVAADQVKDGVTQPPATPEQKN